MEEVRREIEGMLRLICRMEKISRGDFREYGRNLRKWRIALGYRDYMFGLFNGYLVED